MNTSDASTRRARSAVAKKLLPSLAAVGISAAGALWAAAPCEIPSELERTPPFTPFGELELEDELCNRLVNTLLTVEWLLDSATDDSQRAEVVGNLGRRLHAYGYLDQARDLYERSRELTPQNFRFPFMLALIAEEEGDPRQALLLAEQALELAPEHPPLLGFVARLRRVGGDLDGAAAAAARALELEPDLAYIRWTVAEVAAARGQPEEVLRQVDAALAVEPEATLLYRLRATALARLARPLEAATATQLSGDRPPTLTGPWVDSVRKLPFEPLSHARFGRAALRRRQLDVAVRAYGRALAEDPADPQSMLGLGRTYRLLGDMDHAITALRSAAGAQSSLETWLELGQALQEVGDLDGAAAAYRSALGHDPENKMGRFWLAECLHARGESAEALPVLETLLEDGVGPAGYLLAAEVAGGAGQPLRARQVLEAGLERHATDRGVARALARLLATSADPAVSDPGLAVRLARQLVQGPASAQDHALLVIALRSSGDDPAAREALAAALALLSADQVDGSEELVELRETYAASE